MNLVKGEDLEAFDRSIDVHVSRIRAAIEDDPKHPRRIITVRGVGYVFARSFQDERMKSQNNDPRQPVPQDYLTLLASPGVVAPSARLSSGADNPQDDKGFGGRRARFIAAMFPPGDESSHACAAATRRSGPSMPTSPSTRPMPVIAMWPPLLARSPRGAALRVIPDRHRLDYGPQRPASRKIISVPFGAAPSPISP